MSRIRIYLDTSVIGGYYDKEFEKDTKRLFKRIIKLDFDVYISGITNLELTRAPHNVKSVISKIPQECLSFLKFTIEADELGENYIREIYLERIV